jgi:hypothetical protein
MQQNKHLQKYIKLLYKLLWGRNISVIFLCKASNFKPLILDSTYFYTWVNVINSLPTSLINTAIRHLCFSVWPLIHPNQWQSPAISMSRAEFHWTNVITQDKKCKSKYKTFILSISLNILLWDSRQHQALSKVLARHWRTNLTTRTKDVPAKPTKQS